MLLLFLLEENSLENKPFVVEDFCSFSETTCLLLFTFRVGEQRKQERGTRERNVSVSASAFARGDDREYERERKLPLFSGLQFVSPRGEPKQSFTFDVQNARNPKKEVKSEILSFCLKLRTIFSSVDVVPTSCKMTKRSFYVCVYDISRARDKMK